MFFYGTGKHTLSSLRSLRTLKGESHRGIKMDVCGPSSSIWVYRIVTFTLKRERCCPASDLCSLSVRRRVWRQCPSRKRALRFHTSQSSAESRQYAAKFLSWRMLKVSSGGLCDAPAPSGGGPHLVSDGPQEQRIISKIAESAQCGCVQSMSNQLSGRQAGRLEGRQGGRERGKEGGGEGGREAALFIKHVEA